ncbi:MAG: hypothetical protein WDA27_09105 [Actinomycetota bacterium]
MRKASTLILGAGLAVCGTVLLVYSFPFVTWMAFAAFLIGLEWAAAVLPHRPQLRSGCGWGRPTSYTVIRTEFAV